MRRLDDKAVEPLLVAPPFVEEHLFDKVLDKVAHAVEDKKDGQRDAGLDQHLDQLAMSGEKGLGQHLFDPPFCKAEDEQDEERQNAVDQGAVDGKADVEHAVAQHGIREQEGAADLADEHGDHQGVGNPPVIARDLYDQGERLGGHGQGHRHHDELIAPASGRAGLAPAQGQDDHCQRGRSPQAAIARPDRDVLPAKRCGQLDHQLVGNEQDRNRANQPEQTFNNRSVAAGRFSPEGAGERQEQRRHRRIDRRQEGEKNRIEHGRALP